MEERIRERCLHCDESVSIAARVCPFCRQSLLVDVRMTDAVEDPRKRYQIARALVALTPHASLGVLQVALGRPRQVVLAGVTRAAARSAVEALQGAARASVEPSTAAARPAGPAPPAGRRAIPVLAILTSVATAGIVGGLAAALWLGNRQPPAPRAELALVQAPTAAPTAATVPMSSTPPVARTSRAERVRQALRSSVSLRCKDTVASGFFVTRDVVLTNAHALCEPGGPLQVRLSDGREGQGTAIRVDEAMDLALVRTGFSNGEPLLLGDAGRIEVGDTVTAVGSPVGLDFSVSQGTIGNVLRVYYSLAYIQFDAPVNPGNSGGPLLDEEGRVIGVVSMKRMDAEGIGLALPINYAYLGPRPLVDAPGTLLASSEFDARRRAAIAQDGPNVTELARDSRRPLLVDAVLAQDRSQLNVAIYWRIDHANPRHRFTFNAWKGGHKICSATAELADWSRVRRPGEDAGDSSRQARAWLESRQTMTDVYRISGPVALTGCSVGDLADRAHLELQDAAPEGPRVEIRS